jgi:hypothetical protein
MSLRTTKTLGDDSSDNDLTNWNSNRIIVKVPAEYRKHLDFEIDMSTIPKLREGVKPTATTAEGQWQEREFQDEKLAKMKFPDVPPSKIRHIRDPQQAEDLFFIFVIEFLLLKFCEPTQCLAHCDSYRFRCTDLLTSFFTNRFRFLHFFYFGFEIWQTPPDCEEGRLQPTPASHPQLATQSGELLFAGLVLRVAFFTG